MHACQESRAEFLERDDGKEDPTLARRRREHPVYKLCFKDLGRPRRHFTKPVYFSVDVDMLWGMVYKGEHDFVYPWAVPSALSGVGTLNIAPHLKYLALESSMVPLVDARTKFPNIKAITFVVRDTIGSPMWWLTGKKYQVPFYLPPEVDGQMDVSDLTGGPRASVARYGYFGSRKEDEELFKEKFPGETLPAVCFRFRKQFIENEGLIL